jgi:hypothetical protein
MSEEKDTATLLTNNIRDSLVVMEREMNYCRSLLDRLAEQETRKLAEFKADHSDVLALLEPHNRGGESFFQTAQRINPGAHESSRLQHPAIILHPVAMGTGQAAGNSRGTVLVRVDGVRCGVSS